MEFNRTKCPNCGGELRLTEDKSKLKCDWCDTEIMIPQKDQPASNPNEIDIKNKLILAEVEYKSGNDQKAYDYYLEILQIDASNYTAWLGRGKTTLNSPEMLECFKNCLRYYNQDEKETISNEITNWINDIVDNKYDDLKRGIEINGQNVKKYDVEQILLDLLDLLEFAHQCSPQNKETINKFINICKENIEGIDYIDHDNFDEKVINFNREFKNILREDMNLFIGKIKQIDPSYKPPKIEQDGRSIANIDEYEEIIEKNNNSLRKRGRNKNKYILFFLIIFIAFALYKVYVSEKISNRDNNQVYSPTHYALGDTGPAGGIVFYDKGSYSDGWRYLEAAPQSTEWRNKAWDKDSKTRIKGLEMNIGKGQNNTITIISLQGKGNTYATQLCDSLVYGGYSDWFLPSKDELNLMYTNLKVFGVGDFADDTYWSSSETDRGGAWTHDFKDGDQTWNWKIYGGNRVRAVRAF